MPGINLKKKTELQYIFINTYKYKLLSTMIIINKNTHQWLHLAIQYLIWYLILVANVSRNLNYKVVTIQEQSSTNDSLRLLLGN